MPNYSPKHVYIEVFKRSQDEYTEKVIRKDDVREYIKQGWSITRLSKVQPGLIQLKWMNYIQAVEGIENDSTN